MKTQWRGTLALVVVVALVWAPTAGAQKLHESIAELEVLLGTWQEKAAEGSPDLRVQTRYAVALAGRFVESWRLASDSYGSLRIIDHSMIGRSPQTLSLTEYRFNGSGRMTVRPFDPGDAARRAGRRAATAELALRTAPPLHESLKPLESFLGQWEITTDWIDGGLIWAHMSNTAELGGKVVCSKVLAAEGSKSRYDRYRSFFFRDDVGSLREITFSYWGAVVFEVVVVELDSAGVSLTTTHMPDGAEGGGFVKKLSFPSDRVMHWTDHLRGEGSAAWAKAIDANWTRMGSADPVRPTRPIDDTLFAVSGLEMSSFSLDRVMEASVEEVWAAWSTPAGWKAAYGPDRPDLRADISLAPGGKYEWLFDGQIGGNGNQILSYIPKRMLSFSWNAPISQPQSRVMRTWVVVELTPQPGNQTHVKLTHLGFGPEPHWVETRDYFEGAWEHVLNQMESSFKGR